MAKEIELSINEIDPEEVLEKLKSIGAKFIGKYEYKIVNFQIMTVGKINDENYYTSWMRVRTDGKKTTLTLKEQHGSGANKRSEYEVEVSDFIEAVKILRKIMPDVKYDYIEKYREKYAYEQLGIEISIDKWPKIPYKMELEGNSENQLNAFYKDLKLANGKISKNIAVSDEEFYRMFDIDYNDLKEEYREKLENMLKTSS